MAYTGEQKREYQRRWMAERRQDFFLGKRCTSCGSATDLQLHHPDKSTKEDHKIWSWREERREAELKKCVVLCKKCHTTLHNLERTTRNHGTQQMYKVEKCRCELCRTAHKIYSRRMRHNPYFDNWPFGKNEYDAYWIPPIVADQWTGKLCFVVDHKQYDIETLEEIKPGETI